MSSELAGEGVALGAAACFATTVLLVRALGGALNPFLVNAIRCSIAAVLCWLAWLVAGQRQPISPRALAFLTLGPIVGIVIGDSLNFAALRRIGVSRAMPISMGYPVTATILAALLLGEAIGPAAIVGIALTLVGVYLVAQPPPAVAKAEAALPLDRAGVAMAVASAIAWGASTVSLRPALEEVDPYTANAIRIGVASVLLWAVVSRQRVPRVAVTLRGRRLAYVVAAGVSSAVGWLLLVFGIALAGAARASVLANTSPLFAVPLSVVLFHERGGLRLAAGIAVSLVGIVLLGLSKG